jgi:hypothetical protein
MVSNASGTRKVKTRPATKSPSTNRIATKTAGFRRLVTLEYKGTCYAQRNSVYKHKVNSNPRMHPLQCNNMQLEPKIDGPGPPFVPPILLSLSPSSVYSRSPFRSANGSPDMHAKTRPFRIMTGDGQPQNKARSRRLCNDSLLGPVVRPSASRTY